MNKSKSVYRRLISGSFNYGLSSVLGKLIGFILIPLYTIYLTPEDYGIIDLTATLSSFLMIGFRLGIPGSVSRFYFDYKDDVQLLNDYVKTVYQMLRISSLSLGVLISILLYFIGDVVLKGVAYFPFIIIAILSSTIGSNSDLQRRLVNAKEQSAYMVKLNLFTMVITISLSILLVVKFNLGALGLMIAGLVSTIIFYAQSQYYLQKYLRNGTFNRDYVSQSLKYGLGILPHHLFSGISPFISRSILAYKDSIGALGIFSLANRFSAPLSMIMGMVNLAFQPIYFDLRKENNHRKIKEIVANLWNLSIVIYITFIFLIPPLIPLMTPVRYHSSAGYVSTLALSFIGGVVYLIYSSELFYNKYVKKVLLVSIPSNIISLLFTFLLAGKYGALGLVISVAIGSIITILLSVYITNSISNLYLPISGLAMGLVLVSLAYFIEKFIGGSFSISRVAILIILIILPVYKLFKSDKLI